MRRTLMISTLVAVTVGLMSGPASADGGHGGWQPVPADYYAPFEVRACGTTVTIEGGDVREAEFREIERRDGSLVVQYRGEATLDLTRADGRMIDELDIGGRAVERWSPNGARLTTTLWGASLLFPSEDPIDRRAFREAGLRGLSYYTDPDEFVTLKILINPRTGALRDVDITAVKADIVNICGWFSRDRS